MARISLEPKPTIGYRLVRLVLRRRYGVMLDPITAAAHQPQVMRTMSLLEAGATRPSCARCPAGATAISTLRWSAG